MHEHLTRHTRRRHPPVPAAVDAELAGLPETDAARILTVIAANHAPTTLTVYAYAWRQWTA